MTDDATNDTEQRALDYVNSMDLVLADHGPEFREAVNRIIRERAVVVRPPIRIGLRGWFWDMEFDEVTGLLKKESFSRTRSLAVVSSLVFIAYLVAPFVAPFVEPLARNMDSFKWLIEQFRWPLVASVLGLEAVRAIKGGGMFGYARGAATATTAATISTTGGPVK